jgi:flagellar biosynthetic protein FliQ
MKESMILAAPLLIAAVRLLSFLLSLVQTLTSLQEQSLTSFRAWPPSAMILLVGMPWFLGTHGGLYAAACLTISIASWDREI